MNDADAVAVLKFLARHDLADGMFIMEQDGELVVAENCNDLFYWACADMEHIEAEDILAFEQAIKDCKAVWDTGESYAGTVWACRKRGMRPQNPCYAHYPKQIWALLDAAGPERPEKEAGSRKLAEQHWEEKAPPYFRYPRGTKE